VRILICGGRNFTDHHLVGVALAKLLVAKGPYTIIHGDAPGADALAASWGRLRHLEVISFPSDWDRHGNAAGPLRNQRMLDEGKPDAGVAFPGGRGTADMCRRLEAAGLKVWRPYG
jgi:hypothetical protein